METLQATGKIDSEPRYPFFTLEEETESAREKFLLGEPEPTEDGVLVASMEFTARGVYVLVPVMLQCDTLNRYRLSGPLYNQLVDCYGEILYTVLV